MHKHSPHPSPSLPPAGAPLWLAATGGKRLARPDVVADINAPEAPLEVEFIGLTEAEQRAALAAFPGGKRFVLARRA